MFDGHGLPGGCRMHTRTRTRRVGLVTLIVVTCALLLGACDGGPLSLLFNNTGGNGSPCPGGTWQLDTESVTGSLSSLLGDITITPSGTGITLALDGVDTWALMADQTLTLSGTDVNLTATVNATASGTYTTSGQSITFTLQSLTGSLTYQGSIFGHAVNGSLSLASFSKEISQLYGLSQSADFSCGTGTLALTFPSFDMHMGHDD